MVDETSSSEPDLRQFEFRAQNKGGQRTYSFERGMFPGPFVGLASEANADP